MQPVSGDNWTRVSGTAAGTAVISALPCTVWSVSVGNAKTGTVTLYDDAAGTSASVLTAINNNVSCLTMNLGASCKKGLAYSVGGTTDAIVVWS